MARQVTLLHLSDIQFGPKHAFGQGDLEWDRPFDELAARLCSDLRYLRKCGCHPDIVVVSGDLTEHGTPAQFESAHRFLQQVLRFLKLPVHRLIVVPGNHDINRSYCESARHEAQQRGVELEKPYWPKWQPYSQFFQILYTGTKGREFGPQPPAAGSPVVSADQSASSSGVDQLSAPAEGPPWTLFALDDLSVVVAGLNSTIAESDVEGHFGQLTERQLHWFAAFMRQYRRKGWLRIGVVHHPVRPVNNRPDYIQDVGTLTQHELLPMMNVLLHGHTHRDGHEVLGGVLVFAAGSAGVLERERPFGLPNQYQILQLRRDGVDRWARRFDWDRKQWIGDTRITPYGDDWKAQYQHTFLFIDGTLPDRLDIAAHLGTYIRNLAKQTRKLLPSASERENPELKEAFVPPDVRVSDSVGIWPIDRWLERWLGWRDCPPDEVREPEPDVDMVADRIALLGARGAGKRTVLRWVATRLCSTWLEEYGRPYRPVMPPLLPVFTNLDANERPPVDEESWLDLLAQTFRGRPAHDDDALVARVLRAGRVVALVSGLDSLEPRIGEDVLKALVDLFRSYEVVARPDGDRDSRTDRMLYVVRNAIIVGCTSNGWPDAPVTADFTKLELLPFRSDRRVRLARQIYRAFGEQIPSPLAKGLRNDLASLCDRPGPLMIACLLYRRMQRTPTEGEIAAAAADFESLFEPPALETKG